MGKNAEFLRELKAQRMWKVSSTSLVSDHRWEEIVESSDFKASSSTGMLKPIEVWESLLTETWALKKSSHISSATALLRHTPALGLSPTLPWFSLLGMPPLQGSMQVWWAQNLLAALYRYTQHFQEIGLTQSSLLDDIFLEIYGQGHSGRSH